MGCIPYQTVRDAQACLSRNVVLYKNTPHYVMNLGGPPGVIDPSRIIVYLVPLPESKTERGQIEVSLTDHDLIVNTIQVGFVNGKLDSYYCSRLPVRGNAQGLCEGNVRVSEITKFGTEIRTNFNRLSSTMEFHHQFSGKYPDVNMILDEFDKIPDLRSRAFHRQFAISRDTFRKDFIVHYRTLQVGFGVLRDRRVNLTKDYQYLKEQFTEYGFDVVC